MTRDETRFLMARVSRCWGRPAPDAPMLNEWASILRDVDVELAQHELTRMVQAGEPGPSLTHFVATCRAARRAALVTPSTPDTWHGPTEEGRRIIAEIRASLKRGAP